MRQQCDSRSPGRCCTRPVDCWTKMYRFESGQIDERVYAQVTTADNGRLKQARRSLSRAVQQFFKFLQGGRICRQLPKSTLYSAVRLSPVIPNGTFRPGHGVLQFSKPLTSRHGSVPSGHKTTQGGLPEAACLFSVRFRQRRRTSHVYDNGRRTSHVYDNAPHNVFVNHAHRVSGRNRSHGRTGQCELS